MDAPYWGLSRNPGMCPDRMELATPRSNRATEARDVPPFSIACNLDTAHHLGFCFRVCRGVQNSNNVPIQERVPGLGQSNEWKSRTSLAPLFQDCNIFNVLPSNKKVQQILSWQYRIRLASLNNVIMVKTLESACLSQLCYVTLDVT